MKGKNVWQIFMDETPNVVKAWIELSKELNINGVLDEKTIILIKIGIFSVTRDPIALRHFVGEAFKAGISKEEIQAAALLAWNTGVTYSELALPLIQDVEENL
jgi:alkylhydroperoxidase/carboxymuconolactone decarboxylase family protein YurZ